MRHARSGSEVALQGTRAGFNAEVSLDQPAYHDDALAATASEVLKIPRQAFRQALNDEVFALTMANASMLRPC